MNALFSTAYLPPIAWVAKALQQKELTIEAKETFPKQTYRNRAIIMTANGVKALSVPVVRHNHSRTEEVRVDYKERWNIIHLRTIEAAYSASPYYLYYKDGLEAILTRRFELLMDLNDTLLQWILRQLKVTVNIQRTDEYTPADTKEMTDYRNHFSPKVPYPTDNMPRYYQVFSDRLPFVTNLSIIDLLMNLGPESQQYLENCNQQLS